MSAKPTSTTDTLHALMARCAFAEVERDELLDAAETLLFELTVKPDDPETTALVIQAARSAIAKARGGK